MMNKPRRPMSAYFMWLKSSRKQIEWVNPFTAHAENHPPCRTSSEIWRTLDKSVWEQKAAKAKEQYEKKLEAYKDFAQKLIDVIKTDKPRPPMSAYMLWVNASREQIMSENPGIKATEVAKKEEQLWKKRDKSVWEEKAAKVKEQYEIDLEAYYAHLGGGDSRRGKKMDRRGKKIERYLLRLRRQQAWQEYGQARQEDGQARQEDGQARQEDGKVCM